MAFRVDRGSLKPPKRLPDGRLIGEGVLTRSGVFLYRNPDGSERREYRPPDEVFRADSFESFAYVPVTDDHPTEMLTTENAKEHTVGMVGESIRQDGELLVAPIVLHDASTIAKLDSGKTALSCGYTCDIEETPGEINGERYDSIQRNIRGNHVALVDVARAGPEARIRMDAAIMIGECRKDKTMDELTKALKEIAELQVKLSAEAERADKAEQSLKEAAERADKAEAERDSAKEAAEAAEKARTDAADGFAEKVRERVQLETSAAKVMGADYDCSSKSDREIQCEVVKAVTKFDCDGKSDTYVQARFDAALEQHDTAPYQGLSKQDPARLDDGGDSEAEARKRMIQRNQEAGRKPLSEG